VNKPIRVVVLTALLVSVVGFGAAAVGASGPAVPSTSPTSSAVDDSTEAERSATPQPIVNVPESASSDRSADADSAIRQVLSLTAEVRRADETDARLTTWSSLEQPGGPLSDVTVPSMGIDPSRPVWAVAVAGDFVPQFAGGQSFAWGVVILDESTGVPLSSFAGHEAWPPFWDSLEPPKS